MKKKLLIGVVLVFLSLGIFSIAYGSRIAIALPSDYRIVPTVCVKEDTGDIGGFANDCEYGEGTCFDTNC